MAIFSALPYNIVNGAVGDATQVMADFNQIVSNGNANCAKNGVNSDITSITGLLTPLSHTQGGTLVFSATVVGGTVNDIALSGFEPVLVSHTASDIIQFTATGTNTGPVTVTPSGLAAKNVLVNGGIAGSALVGGEIQVGQRIVLQYDGTQYQLLTAVWPTVLGGFITGYTMSPNAGAPNTKIDIAPGVASSTTIRGLIRTLATLSKTTAAWAVGNGNGGLDTGAIAASKFYYVYMIRRTDTGVVDAIISLSQTSPAMPAGYDQYRRIGAFFTTAGSNITPFYQVYNRFYFVTPVGDINLTGGAIPTAARGSYSVTCPPNMLGYFGITSVGVAAGNQSAYVSSLSAADVAPSPTTNIQISNQNSANAYASGAIEVYVASGGQIGLRAGLNGAGTQISIYTYGWLDNRGV